MQTPHAIGYGVLIVVNAILAEFAVQLGSGNVPIPQAWQWVVPILIAGVTATTMLLPRYGSSKNA